MTRKRSEGKEARLARSRWVLLVRLITWSTNDLRLINLPFQRLHARMHATSIFIMHLKILTLFPHLTRSHACTLTRWSSSSHTYVRTYMHPAWWSYNYHIYIIKLLTNIWFDRDFLVFVWVLETFNSKIFIIYLFPNTLISN